MDSLCRLGSLYRDQGRYTEAEPLLADCLATQLRVLQLDNVATLITMDFLAGLFKAQGRYDEAGPLYAECLRVRRETLGGRHTSTLSSMNS